MLNGLDLFSGIGGISLALAEWVRPIAYCEIDPYCQAVLLNRQFDGLLPKAPIWDDINTLQIRGNGRNIDIIYGGFPCQDISTLGNGKGLAGNRSGLCYQLLKISNEIQPKFIFLENVPAINTKGGLNLVEEITKMGYDSRWVTITASSVGALHKRDRWFLLAHSNSKSSRQAYSISESEQEEGETWIRSSRQNRGGVSCTYWKENKQPLFGMAYGLPYELDRAKSLGNSVVPQQVKQAFQLLMGIK